MAAYGGRAEPDPNILLLGVIRRIFTGRFRGKFTVIHQPEPPSTMIQLKPGLQPTTLVKNRKSLSRRPKSGRKKKRGLRFDRVFSDAKVGPFEQLEWERRTAEITDDSGKVIFKQEDIEVPKSWSPLATKIAVSKYFYGDISNGTDPHSGGRETSVRQLIHRVTRTIADCGMADGYFADAKTAEIFYDELTWLCANQHGAFNSPVWFNVGLYHQYGIGKDAGIGNYFYNRDTKEAERAATQYEYPQGSACFIQSVKDTMEDIMELAMSEAMLFKYGSGTGTDLSSLRSTREKLSGGGKPSGPLSFLKVYDQVANVVKSGGKTRRAAKMNTLKDWHPDIEEFIDAKQKEEKKAWALDRAGLRRQLQRRRLRLRHVPEREPERARERRVHERRGRGSRMVDPPGARRFALRSQGSAHAPAQNRRRHPHLRRSRDAVRHHHPQVAHLQRHRPAEFHQSLLRVPLPRQHRLQSRFA